MKQIYLFFILLMILMGHSTVYGAGIEDCDISLAKAENGSDSGVYNRCGFDEPDVAWGKWAGIASQKKWARALYELCVRYPAHTYSDLYCEKSANLGYGPALAEEGHKNMKKGLGSLAVELYARALKTKTLTDEQEGQVAEQLGLYYMDKKSDHFAPAKAVAFFEAASTKRSALANNILGYLSFTGESGVTRDNRAALEYLWRAILLECPAAQENLGLFHLARLKKIPFEMAVAQMQDKVYTCEVLDGSKESVSAAQAKPAGCDCDKALELWERNQSKPYYLLSTNGKTATVRPKEGTALNIQQGQKLSSGYIVDDIRKTAVILINKDKRLILNLMPPQACLTYCNKTASLQIEGGQKIQIKPYRITFTPNECQDILYYAQKLVNTDLPFLGKDQCAGGKEYVKDPLLDLMTDEDPQTGDLGDEALNALRESPKIQQPYTHESGQSTVQTASQKKAAPIKTPRPKRKVPVFTVGNESFQSHMNEVAADQAKKKSTVK